MLVCTSLENIISERGQTQKATYCMIASVQSLSRVRLFATPWIAARQASMSITNSWSLLKFMSIESVMPSSHLILCRPLLLFIYRQIHICRKEMNCGSNQSILKEISPEYSLEGLMLKLKLQYFGHLMWRADSLDKTLMPGKRAEGEGDDRGCDG